MALTLSEKIVSQISDHLVRGELKPGDKLPSERELAEQFGVSRTVVRDAVKTLAGRGILRVRHGAGIFVAPERDDLVGHWRELSELLPLQGTGLRDLFELRMTLETRGAEWAAQRRSDHHLERFRSILDDADWHTDDPKIISERNAQFHVAIAEASQNLVLVRVMLTLLDLLASSRRYTLGMPGRTDLTTKQHRKIVAAIEARDPEAARKAIAEHLNSLEGAIFSAESSENKHSMDENT